MNGEIQAISKQENHSLARVQEMEGAEPERVDLYRAAQRAMRGRYVWAIVLGVIGAMLGGLVGWESSKPLYKSEGLIRVAYETPRVLQQQEDSKPFEIFEAFMQSQQAVLSSRRVVDMALRDPVWKEMGRKVSAASIPDFAQDLKVEHRSGTEHLQVSYIDADPVFAAAAVKSIVNAYTQLYNNMDNQSQQEKVRALEIRRDALVRQLDGNESRVRAGAMEFGSANIDRFYDAAVQQVTKVESTLMDVRIALALAQSVGKASRTPDVQQIVRNDVILQRYMAEREQQENLLEQLRMRGYGEEHPQVMAVKKALEMTGNRIREYVKNYRPPTEFAGGNGMNGQVGLIGRTAEELQVDEGNLERLNEQVKQKMVELGSKKLAIENLKADGEKIRTELAQVTTRLGMLQLESNISGRLTVISSGEVPIMPYRDRRKQMAAGGALAGGLLPGCVLLLIGLSRRKIRYSDDAENDLPRQTSLLGILPSLPEELNDPERSAEAAQCVHHIRVMLQAIRSQEGCKSYLVTSACPGEGKTSLTVALGLSFAASGSRTLLIDADMVAQRLSQGFGADQMSGLNESLLGGGLKASVVSTANARLWVLPAGVADGRYACTLSGGAVKRLLEEARKYFDVVLIDSGPILGSLEASVIAGQVDGAVLMVSRDQQRPLVERATKHLELVGAELTGVVFNRAEPKDFYRSTYMSSLRSTSEHYAKGGMSPEVTEELSRFGPLVKSVATFLPFVRGV